MVEPLKEKCKRHVDIVYSRGKESTCQHRRCRRVWFNPWVGKISWRRKWQPTLVFLPGKFYGQRSLVSYSPWGCKRVRHDLEMKQQSSSKAAHHDHHLSVSILLCNSFFLSVRRTRGLSSEEQNMTSVGKILLRLYDGKNLAFPLSALSYSFLDH